MLQRMQNIPADCAENSLQAVASVTPWTCSNESYDLLVSVVVRAMVGVHSKFVLFP